MLNPKTSNNTPSAKAAERNAKVAYAAEYGQAVLSELAQIANSAVLAVPEELVEGPSHELHESPMERNIEYGNPNGGIH